jgi:hypothetical protein
MNCFKLAKFALAGTCDIPGGSCVVAVKVPSRLEVVIHPLPLKR